MGNAVALADTLGAWAKTDGYRQDIAKTVIAIAEASLVIADFLARIPQASRQGDNAVGGWPRNGQRDLAGQAKAVLVNALGRTLVSAAALGRTNSAVFFHNNAPLCATIAPLDGASEIDANMPVGTIFSLLPAIFEGDRAGASSFLQPGSRQVAAGYIITGPRTVLAVTVGMGTQVYILDRRTATFELVDSMVEIPSGAPMLTVNATDDRQWNNPMRRYVDDWLVKHGESDETSFQMVRSASLATDCHRVMHRGGVQIYPGEARKRGAIGRPNLVFEASPIAWLIEQAGGAASNGKERVLDIAPLELQQRTPVVFGSREEVARIERYHAAGVDDAVPSPLFVRRSLFLS